MKKIIIMLLSIILVSAGAFSFGKKTSDDRIRGTIAYFGNEPFVTVVIKADDGNIYKIKCDEKTLRDLKNEFGKNIEFYGELEVKEKKANVFRKYDGTFKIKYFKVRK